VREDETVKAGTVARRMTVHVDGMTCRHCVRDVTARLRDVEGVERVSADASTCLVVLRGTMREPDVLEAFADTPYVVRVVAG
jgi:copper chaperone CopZ